MKTVYICGDSFGCPDPDSTINPWMEILNQLLETWQIINLSTVCASNLHIRLQVDTAISNRADFIIMLATSCTRGHGRIGNVSKSQDNLLDRFFKINQDAQTSKEKDLTCYSLNSLDSTCVLESNQIDAVKNFYDKVFDLELEIYQNKCIIESTLYTMRQHQVPFIFDQGGFENPKFYTENNINKHYFSTFIENLSEINLWSLCVNKMQHRPYFHITDQAIHQQVAEYYASRIQTFD
jgi:hypothetical protein